ncbi:DUF4058 family protein [Tuwongella immobilis]|uniref:Uncharacterized protein n=1 Tax=Tuwongella immobilis TaxID=692036 RepID=A0A6C2YMK5_9BACT|nr:DUF4058 family protein [Tuwongella immobilis]VIP02353.1 Uncharacterized protein OS=Candidatus Entotheonella sp. TSY2 GN=ETSY2_35130 PE=4 SV=1: DUF4058 [Tuwongella immobilis]VTS01145.1 Uncharacterized protein OS=Candidatus Entotheonella sp. TSY2 GN=ETSY2_35130 PE=4 SV=1: DUF4058 [Tuwongella immobilis]
MAGPFPGMDPWLEARGIFPGVHHSLIAHLKSCLNASLPSGFVAEIANSVWIGMPEPRAVQPDVSILQWKSPPVPPAMPGTATPISMLVPLEELQASQELTDWSIEIFEQETEPRLVTSIELLSRKNKQLGEFAREAYRRKQWQLWERGVNIVEIDLLRFGRHSTLLPRERLEAIRRDAVYHVSVADAEMRGRFDVYAIGQRDPLPEIAIPLTRQVGTVSIPLQSALDWVYDDGRYASRINYRQPCDPPLNAEHTSWAEAVIAGWQPEIGT